MDSVKDTNLDDVDVSDEPQTIVKADIEDSDDITPIANIEADIEDSDDITPIANIEDSDDITPTAKGNEGITVNDPNLRFLDKYPMMGLEIRKSQKSFFGCKIMDSLSEVDWTFEDPMSNSDKEESLDNVRILDPKGIIRMRRRWNRTLEEFLGSEHAVFVESVSSECEIDIATQTDCLDDDNVGKVSNWPIEGQDECASNAVMTRKDRPEIFWTRSRYEGTWDANLDIPWGKGVFQLAYGVIYAGNMVDGQFHGEGTVRYPDGTTVEGVWRNGQLEEGTARVTFRDSLVFKDKDWDYCKYPDRRFLIERHYGLRGAGRSHLTQGYPTRPIPPGFYDTGEGFYNPMTRCVVSAEEGKVLRIPTDAEAEWIKHNCRHGWDENVNYQPALFENVVDSDDLESLLPSPNSEIGVKKDATVQTEVEEITDVIVKFSSVYTEDYSVESQVSKSS